ncbi:MAG: hypothetical protein D6718_07235 [Acidobacteria bacterium]|nr:MAG: hypothetical protein D6718_07235 [Acidobacteriota bacterium]
MLRLLSSVLLGALLLAAPAAYADGAFDLEVRLDLGGDVGARLRAGDRLQVILRPQVQYGRLSEPGEPTVLEREFRPGTTSETVRFFRALDPDQIYRLELRLLRTDERGRLREVRYLSALHKLPTTSVTEAIRVRLHRGDTRDARDNHVLITRDAEGRLVVRMFTA